MKLFSGRMTQADVQGRLNIVAMVLFILVCSSLLVIMAPEVWRSLTGTTASANVASGTPRTKSGPKPPSPTAEALPPLPSTPVSLEGAEIKGNRAARVALLAFSDYQCPFCGVFERETLPQIDKTYIQTGKVAFAYRDFPLETIHQFAMPAAISARCAGDQNRFWEMHALLFENQRQLSDATFDRSAGKLGLDLKRFSACRSGSAVSTQIQADVAGAKELSVTGTPAFFVGTLAEGKLKIVQRLTGAKPFSAFQAVLDPLVADPAPRITSGK